MRPVELAAGEAGFAGEDGAADPAGDEEVDVGVGAGAGGAEDLVQGLFFGRRTVVSLVLRAAVLYESPVGGSPAREKLTVSSNQPLPNFTGTLLGHSVPIPFGRSPAPAGLIRPGCASCTIHGVPPACAIRAHSTHFSKCGGESDWAWQTTSPLMER